MNDIYPIWFNSQLIGGWALPLWKMMDFVSWDHDIPNIWKVIKKKSWKPNHQPVIDI